MTGKRACAKASCEGYTGNIKRLKHVCARGKLFFLSYLHPSITKQEVFPLFVSKDLHKRDNVLKAKNRQVFTPCNKLKQFAFFLSIHQSNNVPKPLNNLVIFLVRLPVLRSLLPVLNVDVFGIYSIDDHFELFWAEDLEILCGDVLVEFFFYEIHLFFCPLTAMVVHTT